MVCVGNEEPWQPRNCGVWQLAGRVTAGNVHWASRSRNGSGSGVSLHMVESVLQHKSLNRLQSSAFNCPCLPVPELCVCLQVAKPRGVHKGLPFWSFFLLLPSVPHLSTDMSQRAEALCGGKQCRQKRYSCFSVYSHFATAQRGGAASLSEAYLATHSIPARVVCIPETLHSPL